MKPDPYAVTHEHATPEELNASLLEQIARMQRELQLLRAAVPSLRHSTSAVFQVCRGMPARLASISANSLSRFLIATASEPVCRLHLRTRPSTTARKCQNSLPGFL